MILPHLKYRSVGCSIPRALLGPEGLLMQTLNVESIPPEDGLYM